MFRAVALFLVIAVAYARHEIYDGNKVFKVSVKNAEEVQVLNDLETLLGLDVWSQSALNHPGLVLVPGDKSSQFLEVLEAKEIQYNLEVENVKELLDLEDKLLENAYSKNRTRPRASALPLDQIYRYDEVNAYLKEIASAYPDIVTLVNAGQSFEGRDIKYVKISTTNFQVNAYLKEIASAYPDIVTLVNAGQSFEGRDIKYVKISTTNFQDLSKPVVYLESLLHAREWITLPATLYAIQKLVIDVTEQDLLQDIDWIIVPIANPDGYEFTHTDQRLWRKNRATGYVTGNLCSGVDLNRNFDIFWSQASSNVVCLDTFHGRAPFSEPETAIIRDIVNEHKDRIGLFLDIHSFGSMILYGYGTGVLPPNGLNVHLVGVRMAEAIDAVKTSWNDNYIVGNVALVLYEASGSAMDYAKSVGVPLAYTYELPGYRYGFGTAAGFFVDPTFIEQAGFETWEGIKTGARSALTRFRMTGGV